MYTVRTLSKTLVYIFFYKLIILSELLYFLQECKHLFHLIKIRRHIYHRKLSKRLDKKRVSSIQKRARSFIDI